MKLVVLVTVLLAAGPALAQAPGARPPTPGPAEIKAGAPQRVRTTNITSNPIGWAMFIFGLSVQYAVDQNVALRVDGTLWAMDGEVGNEISASAQVFLRRAFSGPFIEAGVIRRHIEEGYNECPNPAACVEAAETGPMIMVGYSAIDDNGLNAALALGVMRNMSAGNPLATMTTEDKFLPVFYFRVGYAL